ncbi:MAG TPA: hypothetical protein VEB68_07020 [Croceibacterium sp.]|nr:hypothetical protein [Solirubrobacterales bacterium]HYD24531.1 hypothetical protein [Croceibacterium sp.]
MSAPSVVAPDHAPLLDRPDTRLAAQQATGLRDAPPEAAGRRHPSAAQDLAGLVDSVRPARPARGIKDRRDLPLIDLMAEGGNVTTTCVRPDLGRSADGKITEHGLQCAQAKYRSERQKAVSSQADAVHGGDHG